MVYDVVRMKTYQQLILMKVTHTNEQLLKVKEEMDWFMAKRRPSPEIRNEFDITYRFEGQNVIIYEIRSGFMAPEEKVEVPVAKATFVQKRNHWKVYWMRSDLKWHVYKPEPAVDSIKIFTEIVNKDEHGCFWG